MTEKYGWFVKARHILLFAVGIILISTLKLQATHLRAGQIRVIRDGCSSLRVTVTVTVYTDTGCGGGCVLFGGVQDVLDFGDGSSVLVPETPNTPYPGAVNVGFASYSIGHTFPGPGRYTISYLEPNRNGGVLNMNNSIGTTFYLETQIDLSIGCSNSATLANAPIDEACSGVMFSHNPGASDPDGDSLSYEIVVPYRDRNAPVDNYRDPNNAGFYGGLDYNHANEEGSGPPTFAIDPIDGTLTWDSPGQAGEYNVAFIVKEWRKINGQWIDVGFVRRDMQIIVVADCTNERPELIIPPDTCVVAGTVLNKTILGTDNPGNHIVKIEATSEILASTFDSHATVTPFPAVFQPSNPPAKLVFNWNTICGHVKDLSYQVVFKITDDPPQGPSLATFETWRIKVVGPAPVLQPPSVDLAKRYVDLTWDAYECQNAEVMQVWRRVDETSFTPSNCETGMPESLGYTLIATVPISTSTYKDTNGGRGLSVGAKYCYRLVAQFPLPLGGESYVSDEVCIDPILADAPVITNVTVDKTSATNGEITVRWTPPFDMDPIQFPGPKEYQLQRLSGTGFINENSTPIVDTSFTSTGLNTFDRQYFYRVVLYSGTASDPTLQAVDTSELASSVRLELDPEKKQIGLSWRAAVPWSIQLQDFPLHDVFRGPEGAVENELVLIESVDVIENGLAYLDKGKLAPGDSLNRNLTYCYRVLTRGGYGNPAIPEPLINYSQINCAQPTDDVPPCAPTIEPFEICKDFDINYGCDASTFTNTIRWSVACKEDIRSYNLYVASTEDGTYVLLASNIIDTVYEDKNLSSLARCYKVTAVDRSNNESELSEPACNDNCPYYELPNVFTPASADGRNCNELFRAFGAPLNLGENPDCPEVDVNRKRCARFIQKVDFTVYNRWGGKVYHYVGQQGDENNDIYINWNGRDEKGRELATGVYYYMTEVTRDVVNPSDRVKVIKGWVHLVR
ncbi:MAG TPA: gliding motility-associated C-terminal domain-containing protein [Cyclobacteriaceae bacterium]|nr:gliding motility-associated C-terminal domain-containing protein [Cyclobacteriaceae bacterium]